MDEKQINREKRFRRRILEVINAARPSAAGCRWIGKLLGEDEETVYQLASDLVNARLLSEIDTRRMSSQEKGPAFTSYTITAEGTALLAGQTPVHPLVADERIA